MISRNEVANLVEHKEGVLALEPALVARTWINPGRRLGLSDDQYEAGSRGWVCERWLGSTTQASNQDLLEGEGISTVEIDGQSVRLDHIVEAAPELIMGEEYSRTHQGLGRLAKIFDYGERVPFHIHPPTEQAKLVGNQSKDEAYYFLPHEDLGPHPEGFFGLHSSASREDASAQLVEHLKQWRGERILGMSKAYAQFPEEGFFVPSGVLHAPGTALTLELQEDSDSMAFLQAQCGDVLLSKDLLYKDIEPSRCEHLGEAAILDWIDWELNQDPDFYARFHLRPRIISDTDGLEESWIFWGTSKFSGKRMRIAPGASVTSTENGVYSLFVWSGSGTIAGHSVIGQQGGLDELLVTHDRAVAGVEFENTGDAPLEVIKFFGPDLNPDSPQV